MNGITPYVTTTTKLAMIQKSYAKIDKKLLNVQPTKQEVQHFFQMDSSMAVPVIDLSQLHKDSHSKSLVIKQIQEACCNFGIFHVINHGISEELIEEAIDVNESFFGLPTSEKEKYISDDLHKPVRFNPDQGGPRGISRGFLKLFTHPFEKFVSYWPLNPPDYRAKMGKLAMEMRKLGIEVVEAIMESLNLEASFLKLKQNIEQGIHIVAVNYYPPAYGPGPGLGPGSNQKKIGAVPHTDHGIITVLAQSSPGLEVMNKKTGNYEHVSSGPWFGSIQILVADCLEVLSNGKYKATWHRVIHKSTDQTRISIAGSLSLGMDEVVEPLVDEEEDYPKQYKGSSLREYLNHLASGVPKPFLETIKI